MDPRSPRRRARLLAATALLVGAVGCAPERSGADDDASPPVAGATARTASPLIPSTDRPASDVGRRISPIMGTRSLNQPAAVNGTLFLAGNAIHEIWDVSTPEAPVRLSELVSAHARGEAESHQVAFARFEDGSIHAATISGRGVDLWDVTDPARPVLDSTLELPGIAYGDFTAAVWGLAWQGHHLFVGGTNTGVHVIDTTDARQPRVLRRIGNAALGGVSAGPLFALGNLLVVTTPKENAGLATVDIGVPEEPVLLDARIEPDDSYIGAFFGTQARLLSPFRSYEVLADPTNITLVGSVDTPPTEYVSFADDHAFVGSLRRTAGGVTGVLEYALGSGGALTEVHHFRGRDLLSDDQFSLALGNLLVIADDERGYGAYLTVRQPARDTTGPRVIAVEPRDGARGLPLSTRIGISLSDQVELASATPTAVTLTPAGGAPVRGRFGASGTVLGFSPSAPLLPDTTYTLRIAAGAGSLTDPVGNGVTAEWSSTFTTGPAGATAVPCAIVPPPPVVLGTAATLAAAAPDDAGYTYAWELGGGATASGPAVAHAYAAPGRHPVSLTVVERPALASRFDRYEAEEATLSGGVRTQTDNAGFTGAGYADFPALGSAPTLALLDVRAARPAVHELVVRYANGDRLTRRLDLRVNGTSVGSLEFPSTGAWTTWAELRAPVRLASGINALELRGQSGAGPNVDRLEVSVLRASTCAATQIVHRPLGPPPAQSSAVVVGGGRAWVTNPDHGSVSEVDATTLARLREVEVGGTPRTLVRTESGAVWATVSGGDLDRAAAHVLIIDGHSTTRIALPRASSPYGLVLTPDGREAWVTLEARGEVVSIDVASRAITHTLALDGRPPVRGLAISGDGRRAFVTRFISAPRRGEVYELDVIGHRFVRTWALAESIRPDTPDEGRGVPNYVSSLALSPDGTEAWIPSKQDNVARGMSRDGEALTHDATVRPILTRLDLVSGAETPERRIDLNDASLPVAAVISPLGDLVFAAVQSSNKIEVRETYAGRIAGSITVGRAPEGLALDGDRLYVQDLLGRTLTVIDVGPFLRADDNVGRVLATIPLTRAEVLAPEILRGKQLFYDASDPRLAQEGYISCAACHLEGREDGRVWDFTDRGEGLRNTITLEGRGGTAHGALHWSANFDEVQDFEGDIRDAFGGRGLLSDEDWLSGTHRDALGDPKAGLSPDLDALAAYVSSLGTIPPSPWRAPDGALTADGLAGRATFFAVGCAECHGPPLFTDRTTHDVGTLKRSSGGRRGEMLTGIDTPTLLGAWQTPPYFHDGSAPTLADTVAQAAHGTGRALTAEERRVLVAYLEQLDGAEATAEPLPSPSGSPSPTPTPTPSPEPSASSVPVPDTEGCACASSGAGASSVAGASSGAGWIGLLLALSIGVRRRR